MAFIIDFQFMLVITGKKYFASWFYMAYFLLSLEWRVLSFLLIHKMSAIGFRVLFPMLVKELKTVDFFYGWDEKFWDEELKWN